MLGRCLKATQCTIQDGEMLPLRPSAGQGQANYDREISHKHHTCFSVEPPLRRTVYTSHFLQHTQPRPSQLSQSFFPFTGLPFAVPFTLGNPFAAVALATCFSYGIVKQLIPR